MTIARRITAGVAAAGAGHVINLGWQLVAVPFFLWAWGAERYGEWVTLYATVAYFTLVDAGWTMYVTNRLTASYGVNARAEFQRVLETAVSLYVLVVTALTLSGAAVLAFAPVDRWLAFHRMTGGAASLVAVLLLCQLMASIVQGLLIGIYRTVGEFARGQWMANLDQALTAALTIMALSLRWDPTGVAAIQIVPVAVVTAVVLLDLRRRHGWLRVRVSNVDWSLARSFVTPSLLFAAIQVSLAVTVQASVLVVNAVLGATAVAVFATVRTMANVNRHVVNVVSHAAAPELTRLDAQHARPQLQIAHRLMVKTSLAGTAAVAMALHFCGRDVVAAWTRGRIVPSSALVDALLAFTVVQAVWVTSSFFPLAFNRHRTVAAGYVASSVLGLGLAIVLIRPMGLVGMPVALLCADLATCAWFVPTHVCRLVGDQTRAFWSDVVLRGAPVLLLAWALARAVSGAVGPMAARIAAVASVEAAVFVGVGGAVWLRREDRLELVRLATTVLRPVVPVPPLPAEARC